MLQEASLQSGDILAGKYRVVKAIGAGGHANVYMATQEGLGREVAIKVLRVRNLTMNDRAQSVLVKRFEQEARLLSQLRDSHTVTMFDYGHTDEGLLYMVFEHIKGESLEDVLIREGRVKPARVVKIIRQILSSLQEAHALGVLHRDIKPSNIMVYTHVGRTDLVKVLDFGIAKIVTEQNPDMTAEGSIVGTPRYIAPERLRGDELPTSDLYSVGVLAWELLTGQAALNGKAGMMALRAQLEEPSITLPTHIDVPGALRQIINKLTSKPVVQRYARAEEALDDLEYWSQDLLDNGADDSSDSLPDASASATAVLPVEQLLRANAPDTGEATLKPRVIFERPPSHDDDDDATEMTQQVEPLTFDSDFKTVPQRAITSDAYKTLPMSNVQEHALRDEALDTASRPAPSFIAPQVAPKMRADASPSTRQPTGPMYPQPRLVNTPAQFSAPAQLHTPAPFAQPQTPTPAQHINPSPQDPARSEAFIREHAPPEEKTDSEHVPLTQIMSWIFRIVMIIAMLGVCYYVSQMIQRSF